MKRYLAVLAGLLLLAPAAVLAATNPAGVWEGTIKTPNGDIGFLLNLHRDGDKWAAEMDVPIQGVSGLPVANVKVDGAAISFTMPGQGDPHYEGKLSEDGKTISGNLNAAGQPLPLDLKWKSEPKAVEKAAPVNTGDVQVLEGVWEGALDVPGGQQLHVRFNFTKSADGSITATFDSVDQGVNGLPVNSIARTGDTVKLDLKAVSISYEGTLNKDASAMTGNFSQGGGSLPLNLLRKQAEKKN
jgi:hypothetical protein